MFDLHSSLEEIRVRGCKDEGEEGEKNSRRYTGMTVLSTLLLLFFSLSLSSAQKKKNKESQVSSRAAETVSSLLRNPARNLIPSPYIPRIANEPSPRPITVHCETFKAPSHPIEPHLRVHLLSLSLSFLFPGSPTIHHIPRETSRIMESLVEGRIVTLNARATLHFYISMQNDEKKKEEARESFCAAYFSFFRTATRNFYLRRNFYTWRILT